jgi:MFS family permease
VTFWSAEPARPERVRAWPNAWKLAVATVCFGAFMGQLDASIVTLTYPPMERQFHAGTAAVQWVSLSYLLALLVLLAPMANRSDRHGRKLSYLQGFAIFSAASAACGLAPSLGLLIGARVLQGAGAALLQSNSVALVTTSAPPGRMRAALGAQAAAQAIGLALGPTVGGLIVASLGWRWVYAINVPVGAIALAAGVLFLPRTRTRRPDGAGDLPGSLLIGGAAAALLLALSAAGGLRLPSAPVILAALIVTFVASAVALAVHLRRRDRPVIDPGLLRAPGVARGLVAALLAYLVLFGPLVLVPMVLAGRGVSSLRIGVVLTALPAGFAFAATVGGGVLPRSWSDTRRALVGGCLAAAALGAMLVAPLTTYGLLPWLAFLGIGLGLLAPANNAAIMRSVPPEQTASGGGIISMARALGTAVGIAAVTLAMHVSGPRLAVGMLFGAAALTIFSLLPRSRVRLSHRPTSGLPPNMPGHGWNTISPGIRADSWVGGRGRVPSPQEQG